MAAHDPAGHGVPGAPGHPAQPGRAAAGPLRPLRRRRARLRRLLQRQGRSPRPGWSAATSGRCPGSCGSTCVLAVVVVLLLWRPWPRGPVAADETAPHPRPLRRPHPRAPVPCSRSVALVAVFTIFAFVEELEDLGKGRYRLKDAALFILLTTPRRVIDLAPVTALLASLTALGALASGRELVAMQAAGRVAPADRLGRAPTRAAVRASSPSRSASSWRRRSIGPPTSDGPRRCRPRSRSSPTTASGRGPATASCACATSAAAASWAASRSTSSTTMDDCGASCTPSGPTSAAAATWRLTNVVQKDFEPMASCGASCPSWPGSRS